MKPIGPMKPIVYIPLIGVLAVAGIAWQTYAFLDCREVGHDLLYCVLRLGNF